MHFEHVGKLCGLLGNRGRIAEYVNAALALEPTPSYGVRNLAILIFRMSVKAHGPVCTHRD